MKMAPFDLTQAFNLIQAANINTTGTARGTIQQHPLGRHLPAELLLMIFEQVMDDDRTAIILPRPIPGVGVHRSQHGILSHKEDMIIVGTHPLSRVHKASRSAYYTLYKAKTLKLDIDRIFVTVEDFYFDYFNDIVLEMVGTAAYHKLMAWPFEMRLTFTQDFLQDPTEDSIRRWVDQISHEVLSPRTWQFNYRIDRIEYKYVEPMLTFLNQLVFARGHAPGPELTKLMADIWRWFNVLYAAEVRAGGGGDNGSVIMWSENGDENADLFELYSDKLA